MEKADSIGAHITSSAKDYECLTQWGLTLHILTDAN